jgi:hypothetical protein
MNIKQAEALASRILNVLEESLCIKLRELKPQLEELRSHFKELKKSGGRIAGCKTWDEFCTKKLHRTRRAVNTLLSQANEQQMEREKTSHLEAAQGSETSAVEQEDSFCSVAQQETEQGETCHSEARAKRSERTIDDVDAENLRDATRRTLAYFRPMAASRDKLWNKLTEWFESVASQLGLSVTVIHRTTLDGLLPIFSSRVVRTGKRKRRRDGKHRHKLGSQHAKLLGWLRQDRA